jgi:hypothetical protein
MAENNPVEMSYRLELNSTTEGVMKAGQVLMKWRDSPAYGVTSLVVAFLFVFGGVGLYSLVWTMVVGGTPHVIGSILACSVSIALIYVNNRNMAQAMARIAINSRFGRRVQHMTCDDEGITLDIGTAVWSTRWNTVEALVEGKHGISLVVSGVTFPIPMEAVPEGALPRLRHWFEISR